MLQGSLLMRLAHVYVAPAPDPAALQRFQAMFGHATAAATTAAAAAGTPASRTSTASSATPSISAPGQTVAPSAATAGVAATGDDATAGGGAAAVDNEPPVVLPADRHVRFLRAPPGVFNPKLCTKHNISGVILVFNLHIR
jgi:hypothetical protein